jgi:hypothetical protein
MNGKPKPKRCITCGIRKPADQFPRKYRRKRDEECQKCRDNTKRQCAVCTEWSKFAHIRFIPRNDESGVPICPKCYDQMAKRIQWRALAAEQRAIAALRFQELEAIRRSETLPVVAVNARMSSRAPKRDVQNDLGLTGSEVIEIRERLSRQQGDKCAICERTFSVHVRRHLDHCHATKSVRAVLCSPCNTALGMMRDDPDVLRRAADYLIEHRGSRHESFS